MFPISYKYTNTPEDIPIQFADRTTEQFDTTPRLSMIEQQTSTQRRLSVPSLRRTSRESKTVKIDTESSRTHATVVPQTIRSLSSKPYSSQLITTRNLNYVLPYLNS